MRTNPKVCLWKMVARFACLRFRRRHEVEYGKWDGKSESRSMYVVDMPIHVYSDYYVGRGESKKSCMGGSSSVPLGLS